MTTSGVMVSEAEGQRLTVDDVFPGGPAAFGGLRAHDVVTEVGGKAVTSAEQFARSVEQAAPGTKLTLKVVRNRRPLTATVNVGRLADFHRAYQAEMLRRDPRDPNFAMFPGISAADLQVESQRRLFEQNRRLETTLHDVLDELEALRAEVRELRAKTVQPKSSNESSPSNPVEDAS